MVPDEAIKNIIAAHGGEEFWKGIEALEAEISTSGLLFKFKRRQVLDYVAEVVGAWAHAAHFCENYRDFNGIKAPTRRRVRPILVADKPMPGPILVALDIHHIRPV